MSIEPGPSLETVAKRAISARGYLLRVAPALPAEAQQAAATAVMALNRVAHHCRQEAAEEWADDAGP